MQVFIWSLTHRSRVKTFAPVYYAISGSDVTCELFFAKALPHICSLHVSLTRWNKFQPGVNENTKIVYENRLENVVNKIYVCLPHPRCVNIALLLKCGSWFELKGRCGKQDDTIVN